MQDRIGNADPLRYPVHLLAVMVVHPCSVEKGVSECVVMVQIGGSRQGGGVLHR